MVLMQQLTKKYGLYYINTCKKIAHYANKTGPIRAAYTMLLFKWDTDPTHVPHAGLQPPHSAG